MAHIDSEVQDMPGEVNDLTYALLESMDETTAKFLHWWIEWYLDDSTIAYEIATELGYTMPDAPGLLNDIVKYIISLPIDVLENKMNREHTP